MIDRLRRWTLQVFLARLRTPRDVLRLACKRYAERPALAAGDRTLSYAELGDRVMRMATLWRQWGIGHGAPVFCLLPDGIEQLVVRHAAAEAGAMLTQLPHDIDAAALRQALDELGPQLLVHARDEALPDTGARLWRLDAAAEHALAAIVPEADPRPLDPESNCAATRDYSRAYLHHLVRVGEMLGAILLSTINLAYYQELMAGLRGAIAARRLANFVDEFRQLRQAS